MAGGWLRHGWLAYLCIDTPRGVKLFKECRLADCLPRLKQLFALAHSQSRTFPRHARVFPGFR